MKTHTSSNRLPVTNTVSAAEWLVTLQNKALHGSESAKALAALAILELDFPPTREFLELLATQDEQVLWIGKLACLLVAYKYDHDRFTKDPSLIRVLFEGEVRRPCSGVMVTGLWETIMLAEAWFYSNEHTAIKRETTGRVVAREGTDFYQYGLIEVADPVYFEYLLDDGDLQAYSGQYVDPVFGKLERIQEYLKELAAEFAEAQFLLGIIGAGHIDWLIRASDLRFMPASYRVGFELSESEPATANLHISRLDTDNAPDEIDQMPDGLEEKLRRSAASLRRKLPDVIKRSEELITETANAQTEAAVSQERLLILSALSHTLGNSQSTSRSTVQSAVRILSARSNDMSILERGALDELTTLYATFNLTDTLIKTFKLLVSDPQKLSANLQDEEIDLPPIGAVVMQCLRGTLVSVLFGESFVSQCYNFIGERSAQKLLDMRENFRSELLSTNRDEDSKMLLNWISEHLPGLHISLSDQAFRMHLHNKTEYALVYSIISEVIQNAFNHGDTQQPVTIGVECEDMSARLVVSNGANRIKEKSNVKVGRGGLLFIDKLVDNLCVPNFLAAKFQWDIDKGKFHTNLSLTNLKAT